MDTESMAMYYDVGTLDDDDWPDVTVSFNGPPHPFGGAVDHTVLTEDATVVHHQPDMSQQQFATGSLHQPPAGRSPNPSRSPSTRSYATSHAGPSHTSRQRQSQSQRASPQKALAREEDSVANTSVDRGHGAAAAAYEEQAAHNAAVHERIAALEEQNAALSNELKETQQEATAQARRADDAEARLAQALEDHQMILERTAQTTAHRIRELMGESKKAEGSMHELEKEVAVARALMEEKEQRIAGLNELCERQRQELLKRASPQRNPTKPSAAESERRARSNEVPSAPKERAPEPNPPLQPNILGAAGASASSSSSRGPLLLQMDDINTLSELVYSVTVKNHPPPPPAQEQPARLPPRRDDDQTGVKRYYRANPIKTLTTTTGVGASPAIPDEDIDAFPDARPRSPPEAQRVRRPLGLVSPKKDEDVPAQEAPLYVEAGVVPQPDSPNWQPNLGGDRQTVGGDNFRRASPPRAAAVDARESMRSHGNTPNRTRATSPGSTHRIRYAPPREDPVPESTAVVPPLNTAELNDKQQPWLRETRVDPGRDAEVADLESRLLDACRLRDETELAFGRIENVKVRSLADKARREVLQRKLADCNKEVGAIRRRLRELSALER